MSTDNLNKPALAPPITHINEICINSQMHIGIVGWVRAGFRDGLFQAIMVGEPAPTGIRFI
ncbi:MAG: hypothetical protein P2A85_07120 [Microcoleus anatoxicus]|jgi:hypothetical protein|uniref:hypothetical protein n=1 Tax=Microcoleus TaxID=44471 RepID=UPI00312BBB2E